MGVLEGRNLAQTAILETFRAIPAGTKKTIEQISEEKSIPSLRKWCQEEADKMVEERFLRVDHDGKYVFSRDSQARYSWQPATRRDVIGYYFEKILKLRNRL